MHAYLVRALVPLCGLTLGVLFCPPALYGAEDEFSAEKLSGIYKIVASEKSGEKTPAERIEGVVVKFTESTILSHDKDKQEVYGATYQLDSSKRPAQITMTSTMAQNRGEVARGLIEKDGETIRLIYTLPGSSAVPTTFKTKEGQILVVLQKQRIDLP